MIDAEDRLDRLEKRLRWMALQCRTNMDAYDAKAADIFGRVADEVRGHWWMMRSALIVCEDCGVVQQRDGRRRARCKGNVGVENEHG